MKRHSNPHATPLQWVCRSIFVVLATYIIVTAVDPWDGFPLTTIGCGVLIALIAGLLWHELYEATQYRLFTNLYLELLRLEEKPITSYMHRRLTEGERDGILKRLIKLSDRRWLRFMKFCNESNYIAYEEMDKGIIKDIEMLRALKD